MPTLPRSRRLAHDREYQAVFGARMRKSAGPLVVFVRPNGRAFHRLGLSIGKKIGGATVRTRRKRLLREAFRLEQATLPTLPVVVMPPTPDRPPPAPKGSHRATLTQQGLDVVLSLQPHEELSLEAYRALLREGVALAHKDWLRRAGRRGAPAPGSPGAPPTSAAGEGS